MPRNHKAGAATAWEVATHGVQCIPAQTTQGCRHVSTTRQNRLTRLRHAVQIAQGHGRHATRAIDLHFAEELVIG